MYGERERVIVVFFNLCHDIVYKINFIRKQANIYDGNDFVI